MFKSRKINVVAGIIFFLFWGLTNADEATIYATRYKLRIYNVDQDAGQKLDPSSTTPQPCGMYLRPSTYDSEILCDFDISVVPGDADIISVDFGYHVSYITAGTHYVKIYKNTRSWSGTPQYNDLGTTAWPGSDLLASETCDGTGWRNFNSSANFKSLIEGWLNTSSSNKGIIITNNPNAEPYEISVIRVRLIITYNPNHKPTGGNDAVTVNEDVNYPFKTTDFTYNDVDGDPFSGIKIKSLETGGDLEYNGSNVTDEMSVPDVTRLVFKPSLNGNGTPYATFTHQVSDGSEYSASTYTMTINVTPVNDEPSFTKGSNAVGYEDAGALSLTGWATSLSPGAGNESSQTVSFTVTNNNNSLFLVQPAVNSSGTLTYTSASNAVGSATGTIYLKDNGGTANGGDDQSSNQTFTITVNAVNDEPSFTKGSNVNVLENSGAYSQTGWVTNINKGPSDESGQTVTFTVTNDSNSLFTVQPAVNATGTLTFTTAGAGTFGAAACTIYLKDNGGVANGGDDQSPNQAFTIHVVEQNISPTALQLSSSSVNENVAVGTTVGSFTTTDPNAGQTYTYTLIDGATYPDNANFTVSDDSLQTGAAVNYEIQNSYRIKVRTTDNGLPAPLSFDSVFTITVNDLNDPPTDITLSSTNVLESVPVGSVVGILGSADEDVGDLHTYSKISGDVTHFTIAGDTLKTAVTFNFETNPKDTIVLQTSDGSATFQKQLIINIVDLNDAPTDITLSSVAIEENQDSGTVVGTFSTADPDMNQSHTYSFVTGTGDTDNVKFTITGTTLQIAVKPDYETQNSFSIRVRSTDNGASPLSVEKVFAITVNNANDPPTDITLFPDTVSENLAAGRFVGTFSAVDQDAGDTHTWLLAGGGMHNDSFFISNDSLFTAAALDFETTPAPAITVRATDAGSGIFEKDITITVIDHNVTPVITPIFPADTVIPAGSMLTLTGTAIGEPGPYYTWYHWHPDSASADSAGTGAVFTIGATAKPDSGYYFFTAWNAAGSDMSDTILVHVVRPATITLDLPIQFPAVDGNVAVLSIGAVGDGSMFYQWYENGANMQGETGSKLEFNPVDSALHHGRVYHCEVWNTFHGKTIGIVTSTQCQLTLSRYYNPFKVKAEMVGAQNSTQVSVKVWSELDLSNFPSTESLSPWADSVWVLYKTDGYAAGVAEASLAMISTQEIKDAAPDSLEKIFSVGSLTQPHDSCYWLNYSVLWHVPGSSDTLPEPFAPAGKVFMIDTVARPNPLVIHGEYLMKSDTVFLHIDSIAKLDAAGDSLVILHCSKYPGFIPLLYDTIIGVPALLAAGDSATLTLDNIGDLPIEEQPVYCRWRVIGTNGAVGAQADTLFTIGWPRPVYTGRLSADSTQIGGELHITWTKPASAADSIRIWWDRDTIPLMHTFQIPASQSKFIDTALTITTVKGLDNNKWYCLGLQIFRDDMWSQVTGNSRAWARTALGDTTIVPNIISVDSSWFEDSSNAVIVRWHVGVLNASGDRAYQFGWVKSLDSAAVFDADENVVEWMDVTQKVNETKIRLFPGIIFDTTYAIGLWLRGYSTVLGPGRKSPPTDSSFVVQKAPPFTWEAIDMSSTKSDTIWMANERIFFKKIDPFYLKDTLTAFNPGTLPAGFVNVGGVYFSFNVTAPNIPPFILGLKYDYLPGRVKESDLGLYQYKNGLIYVMHGFQVSSGMVWDTVTSVDLAYPFMILADTLNPVVYGLEANTDTIVPGTNMPTWFSIADNIANVCWQFRYGSGDAGYDYGVRDTLDSPEDTTVKAFIMDTTNAVSELYGVRAIISVSDGVHLDTTNVSRSVRSTVVDSIGILANKWEPVRATAYLNEPALDQIFTLSSGTMQQWTYDIYNYRVYRWYSYDTKNSWMEYADSVKSNFELVPGRLIWCKTAADKTLWLNGGVTTSMKQPYEIELKPNNWTDLCLPYKFPIMLRDILEANPGVLDSLEIYHWRKSGRIYEAIETYVASLDNIVDVIDTMHTGRKNDGYTFYNHCSAAVMLKIPPISLPLSRYASAKRREATHSAHSWQVHFMWKNHGAGKNAFFRRIRCGYRKSKSSDRQFGFMPPTMSSVQVGIRDTSRNKLSGWSLQTSLEKGGISFEIGFTNNGDKTTEIEYFLDNLNAVPEGFTAKILDQATQTYTKYTNAGTAKIKVNAKSSTTRIVVIGTDNYMKSLIKNYLPLKFVKAYPNPFNGRIKIHYRLPMGIKEVHLTLYNLRGQQLWKGIERKRLTPGDHVFYFDSRRDLKHGVLPAGVYIMRMTAKNKAGKVVYGGKKRLTCLK